MGCVRTLASDGVGWIGGKVVVVMPHSRAEVFRNSVLISSLDVPMNDVHRRLLLCHPGIVA